MALELLQVAPSIDTAAFSIIFGGIVLALAIAFGVGGIDAARRIIEKKGEKQDVENPRGTPPIPNRNRVTSAIPGILEMLKKAVDEDDR